MTSKRELVLKAFRGEPVDRVPVGFWHHFTSEDEWLAGFGNQAIIEKNLAGHQAFLAEVEPDFIKLMSDGYFAYPNESLKKVQSIKDLADIEPLGADHPWISEQVELVQKISANFTEDLVAIYNIFAPVTYFKWLVGKVAGGDDIIADFLAEDAVLTKRVLDVIAKDIVALTERIIKEAGADGIYLSNLPSESTTREAAQNQSDKPAEALTATNPIGQSSLAASFGMTEEAFNQKLQELSQLYGVSPDTFSHSLCCLFTGRRVNGGPAQVF